jgi:hypothetical protein
MTRIDPRLLAPLLGLVAAGLTWGAHLLPGLLAVLVGVVVGGAYFGAQALLGGREQASSTERSDLSAEAQRWVTRAHAAVRELDTVTLAVPGVDLSHVRDQAHEVRDVLVRTSDSVAAIEAAMRRVDVTSLRADAASVLHDLRGAVGERARALKASHDALTGQLAVAERLSEARETEVSRLQTSALSLESLVTQLRELDALARTDATAVLGDRVEDATDSLSTLRLALTDAQAQTRRLLGGAA